MSKEEQILLQEIFATPANTLQSNRFEKALLAASCSGKCMSGTCKAMLDSDHDAEPTCH